MGPSLSRRGVLFGGAGGVAAVAGGGALVEYDVLPAAGAMVVDEFLPLLAGRGLDVERMGYLGWSMGGFGALLLGATTGPHVRAVAASSPALVKDSQDAAHDVWRLRDAYADIPLRIDIGRRDSSYRAVMDYEDGLPEPPAGSVTLGSHTHAYWRSVARSSFGSWASTYERRDLLVAAHRRTSYDSAVIASRSYDVPRAVIRTGTHGDQVV